jgi:hypothetical protein
MDIYTSIRFFVAALVVAVVIIAFGLLKSYIKGRLKK